MDLLRGRLRDVRTPVEPRGFARFRPSVAMRSFEGKRLELRQDEVSEALLRRREMVRGCERNCTKGKMHRREMHGKMSTHDEDVTREAVGAAVAE